MAKFTSKTITLSTLLFGAFSMGVFAQTTNRVLVIDEGVDLQHSELAARAFVNGAEGSGTAGRDDDNNGFIDDISGWNAISRDSEFFPAWVRKMFADNTTTVGKLLALYNRIEEGDASAMEVIRSNPDIGQALNTVLGLSHGTHVGGIVVRYGNPAAQVASLNVFTSSQEPGNGEQAASPSFNQRFSVSNPLARFKRLANRMLAEGGAEGSGPQAQGFTSQFDDTAGISAFLSQLRTEEQAEKDILARYVASMRPKVANLSLGAAKLGIRQALDSMWEEELLAAKLPLSTVRTATQESNYQRMLNDSFEIFRGSWNSFFRANSSTLFVVAAGNDADDKEVPNAGDNAINEVLPANCSKDNANVITIAATTPEGVIADFSNYNSSLVQVAAWGTAVPSLAPNNNTVKMSGTSMAAPNAAGVASKLFSVNDRLSPDQARLILEGTVKKFAALKGRVSAEGMIDAQAALDAARRANAVNIVAAIGAAVQSRNVARQLPSLFSSPFETADATRPGQVHKTPTLVKAFMR